MTETSAPVAAATANTSHISGKQAPAASTKESANVALDFSALLTELMGTGQEETAAAPATETTEVQVPPFCPGETEPGEVEEPTEPQEHSETKEETKAKQNPEELPLIIVPVDPQPQIQILVKESTEQPQEKQLAVPGLQPEAVSPENPEAGKAAKPEIEQVWADVRKFEFNVEHEAPQHPAPQLSAQAAPAEAAEKPLLITTDPLMNLRQDTLPPRIVLVQNAGLETRLPERSKSGLALPAGETTSASAAHFSDVIRAFDQVEQAAPAHSVQIPDLPQLKVVRAVSMEVGDADSQVVIRIQERSGDVSLQLNAGSEPLRHELQSSVSSLLNALRQEAVKVSNVEVFRKAAPIDKVRRMKEAH